MNEEGKVRQSLRDIKTQEDFSEILVWMSTEQLFKLGNAINEELRHRLYKEDNHETHS